MITINRANQRQEFGNTKFHIKSTAPGINLGDPTDYGLAQLGRVDYSKIKAGTVVGMHPHRNDEILSYLRKGKMTHEDSSGNIIEIGPTHLMMMNAGSGIYHEETVPKDGDDVDMIQIFIRPNEDNLKQNVQFIELETLNSVNEWRLIGGSNTTEAPLKINSQILVCDAHITKSLDLRIPDDKTGLLYVFDGDIKINNDDLSKGDSVVLDEDITINLTSSLTADLVYFEMDKNAKYTRSGPFSGMK